VHGPELQHTARIVGRRLLDAAGPVHPDDPPGLDGPPGPAGSAGTDLAAELDADRAGPTA
jgi:hypothetical protein